MVRTLLTITTLVALTMGSTEARADDTEPGPEEVWAGTNGIWSDAGLSNRVGVFYKPTASERKFLWQASTGFPDSFFVRPLQINKAKEATECVYTSANFSEAPESKDLQTVFSSSDPQRWYKLHLSNDGTPGSASLIGYVGMVVAQSSGGATTQDMRWYCDGSVSSCSNAKYPQPTGDAGWLKFTTVSMSDLPTAYDAYHREDTLISGTTGCALSQ